MNSNGIIDSKNNPFAMPSWIEQGYELTTHRKNQLRLILGKSISEIKSMNGNSGKYPAFVAIRWGFAKLANGILTPTEKWTNRNGYNEFGQAI